jgi:menaquinol-cytochrome c reductase iron-sulfur subunit
MTSANEAEPGAPAPEGRRRFLAGVSILLGGAAALLAVVPWVGFLLEPLFRRVPETWRDVGPVESFAVGNTVEVSFLDPSPLTWAGVTARTAAWLRRRSEAEFVAFSLNCTHLGCPVRWLPQAEMFMCPCHGGVYDREGQVTAGPPPRPLARYPVRVRAGRVEIQAQAIPIT